MSTATQPTVSPEFAAALRDLLAQTLEYELETTKRVMAALPDAQRNYRPAAKNRSAWEIAWHIAKEDVLFLDNICEGKFDFMDSRYDSQEPKTSAEMADWYDRNLRQALSKIRQLTPQQLIEALNFLGMMTMPRFQLLMLMCNHSVHHRGQLSAYLRPMGARVPSIYGPSADTEEDAAKPAAAD
jgi:uncharacterized damage-inducible protein DinB